MIVCILTIVCSISGSVDKNDSYRTFTKRAEPTPQNSFIKITICFRATLKFIIRFGQLGICHLFKINVKMMLVSK